MQGERRREVLALWVCVLIGACGDAHERDDSAVGEGDSGEGDSAVVIDSATPPPPDVCATDGSGLIASPDSYDFGSTPGGTGSPTGTITLRNCGTETTGIVSTTLGGRDPVQFLMVTDGCSGLRLAPGEACSVDIEHAPMMDGVHAAELFVSLSPGGMLRVALSGMAPTSDVRLSPSTQDFGSVRVGTSSGPVAFTLTNAGTTATGALTARVGGIDASEFVIDPSSTCGPPLASGASCRYLVGFHAALPLGAKSATLEVGDGSFSAFAALSGTSVTCDVVLITPASHDFGSVAVGASSTSVELVVSVPSGGPLGPLIYSIGGANPADFSVLSSTCPGPSGDLCTIVVGFEPSTTGVRTAELRMDSGSGCVATAALSGTGV